MLIYGMTDVGKVRNINQDSFAIEMLSDNASFAVVCDGMGGANAGNIASAMATETIKEYILRSFNKSMTSMQIENILRSAVYSANTAVYNASKKDESMKGMGTTVVLVFIYGLTAYILHVGDSRAYIYSDKKLSQLTVDHSMVQTMIDSGQLTPDEAKVHPNKNIITRALGVAEEVSSDLDFADLKENDVLLLCSDGLSNYISSDDIAAQLNSFDETVAKRLISLANNGGGGDNITAVAVKI